MVAIVRTQIDMVQCKSVKEEVKEHMDKIRWDMNKLKRERAEFKLKAERKEQEMQKVCELPASFILTS